VFKILNCIEAWNAWSHLMGILLLFYQFSCDLEAAIKKLSIELVCMVLSLVD